MDNNNDVAEPNRQEIQVIPEVESIKNIIYLLSPFLFVYDKFILIQFRSI